VVIGVMSYLIAFVVALSEDQPFAPVQVTILLMLAVLSRLSHLVIHRIN
jgi:zinc transport system permease protein